MRTGDRSTSSSATTGETMPASRSSRAGCGITVSRFSSIAGTWRPGAPGLRPWSRPSAPVVPPRCSWGPERWGRGSSARSTWRSSARGATPGFPSSRSCCRRRTPFWVFWARTRGSISGRGRTTPPASPFCSRRSAVSGPARKPRRRWMLRSRPSLPIGGSCISARKTPPSSSAAKPQRVDCATPSPAGP